MASAQYGRQEYWEERYMHKKDPFDWYQHWHGIKDVVTQYVFPTHKILHAGCGNSTLPFDMHAEGYQHITNMDQSLILIDELKVLHKDSGMEWHRENVKKMSYHDRSFDAVIEKGLLDSILCGDRSRIMASRMLEEVHRVLVNGGYYISVTHAAPDIRLMYFDSTKWAVRHYKISKPRISSVPAEEDGLHYIYVCAKR